MSSNISLKQLDAEAEADALLQQDDLERNNRTLAELEESESIPSNIHPVSPVKKMHPAPIICIWIALSSAVILMNSWIIKDEAGHLGFSYPIFLTTAHLVYATIATRLLHRFTSLLDGLNDLEMSWNTWANNILPIGALFSASLILYNTAYITLSVPFIQMLKAFTPVAVLAISVVAGLDHFNQRTLIIVGFISLGVALASYGEIKFVFSGFLFQSVGIIFEASRLVMIQKLLQGMRMDPLVSLYYYAPVCATLNAVIGYFVEGSAPFDDVMDKVGPFVLFINCNVAFLLNVSVVFLIGCASSLILTLCGVLKDILLVVGGVFLLGSQVTFLQVVGYGAALSGLVVFKTPADQVAVYVAQFKALISGR